MKRFYVILLLVLWGNATSAQVQVRKVTPQDLQTQSKFKTQKAPPAAIRLKEINVAALLEEDKRESEQGLPPRFGKAVAVSLSTTSAGSWETVENGTVWKLGITSSGAYSLNFFFDRFYLAPGAELYVYNEDRSIIMGPITADRTDKSGVYATDLLPGSTALFELFEPAAVTGQSRLHLARVVHGYKNMFPTEYADSGFGQSASCNVDINCATGNAWQIESKAVAMILLADGTRYCSGALLNNACQDLVPNFLTAFHCVKLLT